MLELQAYHIFINSLSTRDYAQGGCPPSLVEALPKLLLCASGASASLRYFRTCGGFAVNQSRPISIAQPWRYYDSLFTTKPMKYL